MEHTVNTVGDTRHKYLLRRKIFIYSFIHSYLKLCAVADIISSLFLQSHPGVSGLSLYPIKNL